MKRCIGYLSKVGLFTMPILIIPLGCATHKVILQEDHDTAGNFIGSEQYYVDKNGKKVWHGMRYYRDIDGMLCRSEYRHGKKINSWYVGLFSDPITEE